MAYWEDVWPRLRVDYKVLLGKYLIFFSYQQEVEEMKLEMEELKNEVSNVDQQVSKLVPNTGLGEAPIEKRRGARRKLGGW